MSDDGGEVAWFFGRGASIACGLSWDVPAEWNSLPREECIERIQATLRGEMQASSVDPGPYFFLLGILERKTAEGWRHRLVTTNWDTLLDEAVARHIKSSTNPDSCPSWLDGRFVHHLNGSIEEGDKSRRSSFMLPSDPPQVRERKLESNAALARIASAEWIVVVGLSFEAFTDQAFLALLGSPDLPTDFAQWVVVDPDKVALEAICRAIRTRLSDAKITPVRRRFQNWLAKGVPELRSGHGPLVAPGELRPGWLGAPRVRRRARPPERARGEFG